VKKKKASEPP
jgi:hypothetical protein